MIKKAKKKKKKKVKRKKVKKSRNHSPVRPASPKTDWNHKNKKPAPKIVETKKQKISDDANWMSRPAVNHQSKSRPADNWAAY